jgi:hypothetical protein
MINRGIQSLVLLGVLYPSTSFAQTQVSISAASYFCCGFTNDNIYGNHYLEPPFNNYDVSLCNKVGLIGVHLVGNQLTYDDPLNEDKVCTADVTSLLNTLEPGMWTIQTSYSGVTTRKGFGYHATKPFAINFTSTSEFIPLPSYPETIITFWPVSITQLGYIIPQPNSYGFPWMESNCNKDGSVNLTNQVLMYDDPVNNDKFCIVDLVSYLNQLASGTWKIEYHNVWRNDITDMRAIGDVMRSVPSSGSLNINIGNVVDPVTCLAPLGAHAPAIFLTQLQYTTQKPNSRTRLSFQLAAPDNITEVAIQVDGIDLNLVNGAQLNDMGSIWFRQPSGNHTLGLRIKTLVGCSLIKNWASPLISQ